MLHAKLAPQVLEVLKDKIQLIETDEGAIYLVGPIKLPVNLVWGNGYFSMVLLAEPMPSDGELPRNY